jgi:hypothetical protein
MFPTELPPGKITRRLAPCDNCGHDATAHYGATPFCPDGCFCDEYVPTPESRHKFVKDAGFRGDVFPTEGHYA